MDRPVHAQSDGLRRPGEKVKKTTFPEKSFSRQKVFLKQTGMAAEPGLIRVIF
jgi:hypothetical protein